MTEKEQSELSAVFLNCCINFVSNDRLPGERYETYTERPLDSADLCGMQIGRFLLTRF